MSLTNSSHQDELRAAGWHSRGYLPHFDGRTQPQFITLHLADSLPKMVLERWERELTGSKDQERQILLQKRIERYLDLGYGNAFLKDKRIATIVQDSQLKFDGQRYNLHSWVVMPNHIHSLFTRFENLEISRIMQSLKSFTAHEANKILQRTGKFWIEDYFDRYIRNEEHFRRTVRYIENNPVKARLCAKPEDWPFSSAWFRARVEARCE
ncbi:MAG: REP-associated tyrosine transposase [Pyrinomonadaceae bacterium]